MFTKPGKSALLSVPTFVLSMLPKVGCPLCWGTQFGWASSAATAYLAASKYFAPFALVALGISWIVLAREAAQRKRYGALSVATLACILILVGRTAPRPAWRTY